MRDIQATNSQDFLKKTIAQVLVVLVIIVSLAVMTGWLLKIPLLIQVLPTFVPMQFNTALCFFLSSLSILLICWQRRVSAVACACLTLIISSLTLLEYVFNINLGIDQLFVNHYITTATSHPGRMSPNTGLAFCLVSTMILIQTLLSKTSMYLILCLNIALLFISGFALYGYMFSFTEAYGWDNFTHMAVHTASSFVLISLAYFLILQTSIKKILIIL